MQQLPRCRLEQGGGKDVERAEGHADLAQEGPHLLGQMLQPGLFAGDVAMPRDQVEQQRPRLRPRIGVACRVMHFLERFERGQLVGQPALQRGHQLRLRRFGQRGNFACGLDQRVHRALALLQLRQDLSPPADRAARQLQLGHVRCGQRFGAFAQQLGQALFGSGKQHPAILVACGRIDAEPQSLDLAERLALDGHGAILANFDRQNAGILAQ